MGPLVPCFLFSTFFPCSFLFSPFHHSLFPARTVSEMVSGMCQGASGALRKHPPHSKGSTGSDMYQNCVRKCENKTFEKPAKKLRKQKQNCEKPCERNLRRQPA